MKIEFHIDQITEMMKYLDELPHKYARGLIEYIQAYVKTQLPQPSEVKTTEETVGSEADKITVQFVPADEQKK